MSYQFALVRFKNAVIDSSEVIGIERHKKNSLVYLRGGGVIPVRERYRKVAKRIWGDEAFREMKLPGDIDVLDVADQFVCANGDGLEEFEKQVDEEQQNIQNSYEDDLKLHKPIDAIFDRIGRNLRPMFPRRKVFYEELKKEFSAVDGFVMPGVLPYVFLSCSLWEVVDYNFRISPSFEENNPMSAPSVKEACAILEHDYQLVQIPWLRAKVFTALDDIDTYWGRENFDGTEEFEKFLLETVSQDEQLDGEISIVPHCTEEPIVMNTKV